jgi:hypothetical protein
MLLWSAAGPARDVPFAFQADFHHGFNGWMSYPLPQDIGFDPTLLVEPTDAGPVLIRQVASAGQANLSAGFIRPLHFLANAKLRVELRYSANWPSTTSTLKLFLAAENGRVYETSLPAEGSHEVSVTGDQLGLAASSIAIEAIVLLGRSNQPQTASNNRVVLRALSLVAARPAEVPLRAPHLVADPDDARISAQVIDASQGLPIEPDSGALPVRITLIDGAGRHVTERTIAAPGPGTIPLGPDARPGLWTARLHSGGIDSEFSFLVLNRIPAHPRVLLSPMRLAQLRSASEFAALRQQVHEQAESLTGKLQEALKAGIEIASLPPGSSLRPSFDGELTHYFQLVESYSSAIALDALDYCLTGNSNSFAAAHRELLAVARWPTWTPPRFSAHGMHTYYETGLFAQRLAFAYDLIAGGMQPAEKREVAAAFWSKCIEPTVDEYFLYNRLPTGASNWMSNSVGGAVAAAIAVLGDDPDWRNREGVALAQLVAAYERNLRGLFPGDGSEIEPAGYEHFAMQGISWGAAALRSLEIRPAGSEKMLEGFRWPDYAMVRPNLVLDTGDFNGEFRSLSGFAFGAEYGGIPALRAFYDRLDRAGQAPDLLDLLCCTHGAEPVPHAPFSHIFEKRGSAVLRSGWGQDATVISLRAGPWFNHEHHDQGTFQVAALGTRLISEAGYANYYLDPNYPAYFTQPRGHNTVLLDDDSFSQSEYDGPFWKALNKHATFTGQLLSPAFDYIAADLTPAYGGGVAAYTRQYLFLAPDVLIVRDDLRATQPHVFNWLMHAAAEADVEAHGSRATIRAGDIEARVEAHVSSDGPSQNWEVRAMPSPAAVNQILGNVVVYPGERSGERKEPHRYALSLTSPRSATAQFEVTMQFGRRSDTPAPEVWALFRSAPGKLRSGDMESDAAVFAGRGAESWIAIGAREVERAGMPLFTASVAANAAWSWSREGIALDLELSGETIIDLPPKEPVISISLDGLPVRHNEQNGRVRLPPLRQGEHHVWIATRAAL